LISPTPNTTYRITPNLDLSAQQLSVEAVASQGFSKVTIYADGDPLQTFSAPPYQAWWTLSAGEHQFWAEGIADNKIVTSNAVNVVVSP